MNSRWWWMLLLQCTANAFFTNSQRKACPLLLLRVLANPTGRTTQDGWNAESGTPGVDKRRVLAMMEALPPDFTCVVTGAAGGIGRAICEAVIQLGGNVIAVDVNERGLRALRNVTSIVMADFSDLNEVAKAAKQITTPVDIIVNNAGIFYNAQQDGDAVPKSCQDYDLCFAINYLAHYLWTELLIPKMRPGGRVVAVTSGLHWGVNGSELVPRTSEPPIASIGNSVEQHTRHISNAYGNSKLAQLWHSASLNRRGITSVCACPTWAATGIAGPENTPGQRLLEWLAFSTKSCHPRDVAGPAVSSVLNAMFQPELDPNVLTSRSLFGNTQIIGFSEPVTSRVEFLDSPVLARIFGSRALFCQLVAWNILLFQRWNHVPFMYQATSYEAGNLLEEQELLESWSRQVVLQWLPPNAQ